VKELDAEMQAFLCENEDCCVEFYHTPGELYPLISTDESRVSVLHAQPHARTVAEAERFANDEVQEALSKALRDAQRPEVTHSSPTHPPHVEVASTEVSTALHDAAAAATPATTPFSAAELRNIQALLDAVGPETSLLLHRQLQHANVSVATKDVQQQEHRERLTRKRQRATAVTITTPALQGSAVHRKRNNVVALPPPPPPSASTRGGGTSDWTASSTASSASASQTSVSDAESETHEDLPFVPAVRRHVLEVLRHEVFENPARFVLSPIYHFVEILGAVVVENASLATTLPSPRALREVPTGGFAPQRRVLLVPLTENYEHTTGWMVPTELDGASLSMSLFINDTPVPLPPNWQLSPAKEAAAVKTAITADVTDVVLKSSQDLFSLNVIFSGDVAVMEMWRGVIACVFVEEIGLARLGERIVGTYRKPRLTQARRSPSHGHGGIVDMTEAFVKIQCPITTLVMEIPVRSVHCEHLQCMELAAVLIQCVRQNVWNCPLCNAAMKPEDIRVNYRLRDWIASHPQQLSRVEYVAETQPGNPLKVVYRAMKQRHGAAVEVVDDDEDNT
jgi:hypothetical protein